MLRRGILLAFLAGIASASIGSTVAQQVRFSSFPDVLPQQFFFGAVNRFASLGILTGYNSGYFGPNDVVTRGQIAVILDRYDKKMIEPLRSEIGLAVDKSYDGDTCGGGYSIGQTFIPTDGCNTCTCTEDGIACTEKACAPASQKCFTTDECSKGEVCSVELGDCRFPCPQGAVCIQACAGICVPAIRPANTSGCIGSGCGNPLSGPTCGNAQCEDGEEDVYTISNEGPVLLRRGTCHRDCEGGSRLSSCSDKKRSIDTMFEEHITCTTDSDCALFVNSCSPYQTCGMPIRSDELHTVSTRVLEYAEDCADTEPSICAGCIAQTVICKNTVCTLREDTTTE